VDGCYSFWQGACFPILQEIIGTHNKTGVFSVQIIFKDFIFDQLIKTNQFKINMNFVQYRR